MNIFTVIGARPQFIKAATVSNAFKNFHNIREFILHTGQHFDHNMSKIFFEQLKIPQPNVQLNINGGTHGEMTGRMLQEIERELLRNQPDLVLVYGDTNSTLSGALAAVKLKIPVAHVEAGLRSFNLKMPEEINRIITDQISDILFCPTDIAMRNLHEEGVSKRKVDCIRVGDVMEDAVLMFSKNVIPPEKKLPKEFILVTIHRAENTDNSSKLRNIIDALNEINNKIAPVILPLHPRTRTKIKDDGLNLEFTTLEPVSYFEMLWLIKNSSLVVTDSGGLQKEAFFMGKACVTLRDETEWLELLEVNANKLVGANKSKIVSTVRSYVGKKVQYSNHLFGGGNASMKIAGFLSTY